MKIILKHILSVLLIITVCMSILGACALRSGEDPDDSSEPFTSAYEKGNDGKTVSGEDAKLFSDFIDELFAQWVTEDTITLNFFVANPEKMGIARPVPTYGKIASAQSIIDEREETHEYLAVLETINRNRLSSEMQVIYDIILRSLEYSLILEEKDDYSYYSGYIRPLTGIQVQLPVLLAEFNFYTQKDIEDYLLLLSDTVRFFDDIIAFESERASRGFFMTEANLDEVIEQLESFLEPPAEESFLISFVNEKIDNFPGLSDSERERYKEENRELVINNVLVAYGNLLDAMISLKGTGHARGGLASLPDGKKVAHAALCLRAGTDRTAEQLYSMLEEMKESTGYSIGMALYQDDVLLEKYSNSETGRIPDGTPGEYLTFLHDIMYQDFPDINNIDYRVLEIHESLADFTSPAFFLVPAIDVFDNNVIYINPNNVSDNAGSNLSLFTTLAHEGYPGHMYQMVYQRQKGFHPMRFMLSNTGYTEGWATYAEHLSYMYAGFYSGLPDNEISFMQDLNIYFLILQSLIDVGVNLFDWGIGEVAVLMFEELGVEDDEYIENIYNGVTGVPLNSCTYAIGFIEMLMLMTDAQNTWGDDFTLLGFNGFILDFGPAPFRLIAEKIG